MIMRSPDELLAGAKEHMLHGRDPESEEDWAQVVNYFAFHIACGLEVEACKLLRVLYDIPLSEKYVVEIAEFQAKNK